MKMVILAAGVGSRLRPLTDAVPKCLVPVRGKPILGRLLEEARRLPGLTGVVVVTGYRREQVAEYVEGPGREDSFPPVALVPNHEYESTNNACSLLMAAPCLGGEDFLLLDGDLVLQPGLLARLAAALPGRSLLAVDDRATLDEEAMKYRTGAGGEIRTLSKDITLAEACGESIGVARIAAADVPGLVEALVSLKERGLVNEYYERAFQELIERGRKFYPFPVAPAWWVEIDDAADLARAEERLAGR